MASHANSSCTGRWFEFPIRSNNGTDGVLVHRLGHLVFSGSTPLTGNLRLSVRCQHVTSITNPTTLLPPPGNLTLEEGRETNCPATNL